MGTEREELLRRVLAKTANALQEAIAALCRVTAEAEELGGGEDFPPDEELPEGFEEATEDVPDVSARMGDFFRSSAATSPVRPVRPRAFEDEVPATEEDESGGFSPRHVVELPEESERKSIDGENPPVVHLSDAEIAAVQRSRDLTVDGGDE